MTANTAHDHVLVVTGLETDPDDPSRVFDDNPEAHVECLDPERVHCQLWIQCFECRNADFMTVLRHAEDSIIHGEAHRVRNRVLVTDTGECISTWDDCNDIAHEAGRKTGNGRWFVDVKWTDGLEITVGEPVALAPESVSA